MQPYDMKELEERVILVGVQESFSEDVEESLDELAELCETAGALAERHSACHTACSLKLLFFQRQRDMKFVKIFNTFKRCNLFTHSSFVL